MHELAMRPIPKPLHGLNLRIRLGKPKWARLRKEILEQRGGLTCETCGKTVDSTSELQAHESWDYDTSVSPAVARLRSIILSCALCHHAEHFTLTLILQSQGKLPDEYVEQVIAHYCSVNKCERPKFESQLADAMENWSRLNELSWSLDFGAYAPLIRGEPPQPLPGNDAFDDDRAEQFIADLNSLCARYGYWVGRTSAREWLPIHLRAPGIRTGGYEIAERHVLLKAGGNVAQKFLFLSWADDPKASRTKEGELSF